MTSPSLATHLSIATLTATFVVSLSSQAQALSFSGTSSGQWGMPEQPSGSTVISSLNGGTQNRLSWGRTDDCGGGCTPFNNFVQYDGTNFSTGLGSLFNLGQISYRNGSVWDFFNGDFPLNLSFSLLNPVSQTTLFNFGFNILNTPNVTGNAVLDGDRLRFSTAGLASQTFNYDGFTYTLALAGFSTDGGQTLVSEFNSPEGTIAQASLYGKITRVESEVESVPEPATLTGLALLGSYLLFGRRNQLSRKK